jgi:hypothetical protein
VIGNRNLDIRGNSDVRMWLYAPQSTYRMNGGTNFWGSIITQELSFIGTSNVHYDESFGGSSGDDPFTAVLIK